MESHKPHIFIEQNDVTHAAITGNKSDVENLLNQKKQLVDEERYEMFLRDALYGYAIGGHKELVNDLLYVLGISENLYVAIIGYARGGHREIIELLKNEKDILDGSLIGFILGKHDDYVEELFKHGAAKIELATYAYIMSNQTEKLNQLLRRPDLSTLCTYNLQYNSQFWNTITNQIGNMVDLNTAIFFLAKFGCASEVNRLLLKENADPFEAISGYSVNDVTNIHLESLLLELLSNSKETANAFIKRYSFNTPTEAFQALALVEDPAQRKALARNKTLKQHCQLHNFDIIKLERITSKYYSTYKKNRPKQGFNLDHFVSQITQYETQRSQRKVRIALGVLAAIFLTPFSIPISVWLYHREKKRDPIQEFVIPKNQLSDEFKQKLKTLYGKDKPIHKDKPKKILLSQNADGALCIGDVPQKERQNLKVQLTLFHAINNKPSVPEIKQKIQASKEESKTIMQTLKKR